MKTKRVLLIGYAMLTGIFASLAAESVTAADSSVILTLDQCIEIALSQNPTIHVADMEIDRLDLSRKETIGQLLPNISFTGMYNRMIAKQVAYMNMDNFPGFGDLGGDTDLPESSESSSKKKNDNGIKMGLDNSYQLGFSASLPLIAPQLWKAIDISDTQILQSIEEARSSRLSLVAQIKNAYYTLMLARDSRQVIMQNLDMARFTATLYQKKFEVGTASRFEVLRANVAVANIEPELTRSELSIKQARLQLLLLMGIGQYIDIDPVGSLADIDVQRIQASISPTFDLSGNTDLRKLDLNTQLLNNTLKVQQMAWYPTLALTASYNWTSSSDGNPLRNFRWNPYSVVGLTLSVPIYQGGMRYNRIKQAKIQVDEMKWQRENLVNAVNTQVNVAYDNINLNLKQIASCGETVNQASVAHEIVAQSFEIGAATYLDLRDAELSLTTARLSKVQAIYDYIIATINLEQLLGSYNVEQYMPAR